MPIRKQVLATGQFYHIFNKTLSNLAIFDKKSIVKRTLQLVNFTRFKPDISYSRFKSLSEETKKVKSELIFSAPTIVSIHSLSLMPNHFHFLLCQLVDNGISKFLADWQNGVAKYYNIKYQHEGKLFKESFQAVRIETTEQLIHVSRYIHLNHITAYLMDMGGLDTSPLTSFAHYMGNINYDFIDTDLILGHFGSADKYKKFVTNQIDYQRQLKKIRHLILDGR